MAACEVHHVVSGREDGPALVLLNSLGSDLGIWEPQLALLGARFRLIRFDLRGHGASPVPRGPYSIEEIGGDVLALLDRLGIQRASLCGISLGGATAVWLAAHASERVDGLVVCCSSTRFGDPEPWLERAALVRAEGTDAVADAVVRRWVTPPFEHERPDVFVRMRAMIAATPAEGYAACCEAIAPLDLRDELGRISAPTLVISGHNDPATPPEHGLELAAGIPNARFLEVPGAHIATFEHPEATTIPILEHLGGAE